MAATRDYLSMFVITYGTRDYGNRYVVREQRVVTSGVCPPGFSPLPEPRLFVAHAALAVAESLEEARAAIPPDNVLLARDPREDPCIVEVWL